MDETSVEQYLRRIAAEPPSAPTVEALAALQMAHLLRVPFENLDIHLGVPIVLDPASIRSKVVDRRRGGYCYELNSAFGALLAAIGFGVTTVSARVAAADGELGPDFDHMALIVDTQDGDERLLADVGFGDAFTVPVPLIDGGVQPDRDRRVRLARRAGADWHYEEDRGDGWEVRYAFTTVGRALSDFEAMNHHQQTSPDSHFTRQPVCSLLTAEGRRTISGDRLIVTNAGARTERTLAPAEVDRELRERFGLQLARRFPP